MIFDSHCHLNDKALMDDLDNVIQRAKDNGVDKDNDSLQFKVRFVE
mgnify:CR=1 FL=1